MDNYLNLYSNRFFKKHKIRYEPWQIDIAKGLQSHYHFSSVFDFGCGIGSFLLGFYRSGLKDIGGCDACLKAAEPYISKEVRDCIFQQDLTHKLDMKREYDCVMSVEVAEHIPPEGTDVFLNNIVRHASRYIFFTAATPNQWGKGHINRRPYKFWKDAFLSRGFIFLESETNDIKDRSLKISSSAGVQNIMLYKRKLTSNSLL